MFFFSFLSENLKSVIAKQEAKVTEMEKINSEIEMKKKKSLSDIRSLEEKLAKQENLVIKPNKMSEISINFIKSKFLF